MVLATRRHSHLLLHVMGSLTLALLHAILQRSTIAPRQHTGLGLGLRDEKEKGQFQRIEKSLIRDTSAKINLHIDFQ
jgi:hypothetical protein